MAVLMGNWMVQRLVASTVKLSERQKEVHLEHCLDAKIVVLWARLMAVQMVALTAAWWGNSSVCY